MGLEVGGRRELNTKYKVIAQLSIADSRSFIRVILNDTHRELILEDGGLNFKRNKKDLPGKKKTIN